MLRLTVVAKIMIGFSLLGVLLLATNAVSYFGLSNIRQSAESVINEKMPLQSQMLSVQTLTLNLGKASLRDYYVSSSQELSQNKQQYDQLKADFRQQLNKLGSMIRGGGLSNQFNTGKSAAEQYLSAVENMYSNRTSQFQKAAQIADQLQTIEDLANDSTSFLLDLAFLDGAETDPQLSTLAGQGNNIDTQVIGLLGASKELANSRTESEASAIKDNMTFALSNIEEANAFLNRSAEGVDTGGLIESYSTEYVKLEQAISGSNGIMALNSENLDLLSRAQSDLVQSEQHLDNAISQFESMFSRINQSTLEGQNTILDDVQSNVTTMLTIMVFGLIAAAVIAVVSRHSIATPLERISSSLLTISSGDLTHQADARSHCEFGELARRVNELSQNLQLLVVQILQQEDSLERATQESVKLGNSTLTQVDEQREQIRLTAENTQQVRDTSQNNVKQINYGMEKLAEVTKQSTDARKLVQETREQVLEQAHQAQKSSEVISRLDDNSKNIGSILDVIKTIAEQTNLLALNAAIEAARAGEQGRGFAVVADEVRTLANRTQNSTEEIEKMIASLQSDAQHAVTAIAQGKTQSEQSVELIETVNHNVATISGIIEELAEINQQIVRDTGEQDHLLQSVAERLSTIVDLAEKSAETTAQSNDASQQVGQLTNQLNQAVSKFKV